MTARTHDHTAKPRNNADHCGLRRLPALLVALALLASACAMEPAAQTAPPEDPVAASRAALTSLLVLSCRENSDCATVGVGARACGGPEQYLAYAVRETSEPALRKATQNFAQRRRKQLEERGEMSTCELLPDPGARCTPAGLCALQTGRGASPNPLTR